VGSTATTRVNNNTPPHKSKGFPTTPLQTKKANVNSGESRGVSVSKGIARCQHPQFAEPTRCKHPKTWDQHTKKERRKSPA